MAAAALLPEIGLSLAFTMIALAPFLPSLMKKPEGPHTTVVIAAGQPHLETTEDHQHKSEIYKTKSFGGTAPNIALFTNDGTRIGTAKGRKNIKDGNVMSVDVLHWDGKNGNPGASYMTVSAASSGDAICISHMSVLDPTDGEGAGDFRFVPGEIAATCNNGTGTDWPWYYSDAVMEIDKDNQKYYSYPACLMLDRDAYRGEELQKSATKYQGFQIRLMDFTKDNTVFDSWQNDTRQMCNSPSRFHMYEQLNEMQCPNIFTQTDLVAGALLPLPETVACEPSVLYPRPYLDPPCANETMNLDICPLGAAGLYKKTGEPDPVLAEQQAEAAKVAHYGPYRRSSEAADEAEATSPGEFAAEGDLDEDLLSTEDSSTDDNPDAIASSSPDTLPKRQPLHRQLIRSSIFEHSALRLCRDRATVGPDFFSEHEQILCQTSTHTVFPVCDSHSQGDCFDVETELLVYDKNPVKRARRGMTEDEEDQPYVSVKRWARQH